LFFFFTFYTVIDASKWQFYLTSSGIGTSANLIQQIGTIVYIMRATDFRDTLILQQMVANIKIIAIYIRSAVK